MARRNLSPLRCTVFALCLALVAPVFAAAPPPKPGPIFLTLRVRSAEDFVAATKAATNGKGANVVLDMVGGDYIERNYEAAGVEGRIVQIAFQGSPKATVNFTRIMLKRLTHTGSTLRARSIPDKAAIARAAASASTPLWRRRPS